MKLTGWGRYPEVEARTHSFETLGQLKRLLQEPEDFIIHGMGRSYGDSALAERVLFSRRFNKILDFDEAVGVVTCESGVTLEELIQVFLPRGWFLGVAPGTKQVTVGGAVAADVHGKNHHCHGCISEWVVSLDLLLPDGRVVRTDATEEPELFRATCGGMGLTGVILNVALRLAPIHSASMRETVIRCPNLEEAFRESEAHREATYSVAWIDCLARGEELGRSLLMLGEHAEPGPLTPTPPRTLTIPFNLPAFTLNRASISLFNALYYRRPPDRVEGRLTPLEEFFFPLDRIRQWNRLYGRRGFTQYQFVLPRESSFAGVRAVLTRAADSGLGSFLGVLKLMGPANANLLSFPREGYTLALDFKITDRLFPLLDELDRIVLDHGGRLYLAKDMRLTAEVFRRMYPAWEEFMQLRERYGMAAKFNSRQSRRLGV
ncbi:MAG: FAD-binding oxidoreductase [Deltaproteobacteria bacterium]|nr:FAD-binding oxidoreductase [Deltaproteobacteria bacterium]